MKSEKSLCKLFFLFLISLCLSSFYYDVGFSIKPYMIVSLLFIGYIMLTKMTKIILVSKMELSYLIFVVFIAIDSLLVKDNLISIRYLLGLFIMLVMYFLLMAVLNRLPKEKIIRCINKVGVLFSIVTLSYYMLGIISTKFVFNGNGQIKYGVLLDRNTPRLITLASLDPNISCITLSMFFFMFKLGEKNKINKFGKYITLLCIILTMSRGAYLAVVIAFFIEYIFNKDNKTKKISFFKNSIKILFLIFAVFLIFKIFSDNMIVRYIIARFDTAFSDGGSGRVVLWKKAFEIFSEKPFFGVGINKLHTYLGNVHVHNTYLQVLGETGLIGFIIYMIFMSSILEKSINIAKIKRENIVFVSLTVCLLVQSFFLSIIIQETFFSYLAILSILYKKELEESLERNVK